jgi:hypothetical protein
VSQYFLEWTLRNERRYLLDTVELKKARFTNETWWDQNELEVMGLRALMPRLEIDLNEDVAGSTFRRSSCKTCYVYFLLISICTFWTKT